MMIPILQNTKNLRLTNFLLLPISDRIGLSKILFHTSKNDMVKLFLLSDVIPNAISLTIASVLAVVRLKYISIRTMVPKASFFARSVMPASHPKKVGIPL